MLFLGVILILCLSSNVSFQLQPTLSYVKSKSWVVGRGVPGLGGRGCVEDREGDADAAGDQTGGLFDTGLSTPILASITSIYFIQGALSLSRLATTYILKDEFHLDASSLAFLTGIISIPWTIKPFYGFLTDTIPLFGYRRKSYLFLAGILSSLGQYAVSQTWLVTSAPILIFAVTLSSLGIAMSDVVADSIVVERTRSSSTSTTSTSSGNIQSLCWLSASVGGIIAAFYSGSLITSLGPRAVFSISSALPLVVAAVAVLIDEPPPSPQQQHHSPQQQQRQMPAQLALLQKAILSPSILFPLSWIFLWQASPNSETAFFFYLTDTLKFTPEILGNVKLVTAVSGLFGILVYRNFLTQVPAKKILKFCGYVSLPLGLTPLLLINGISEKLHISSQMFVYSGERATKHVAKLATVSNFE